MTNTELKYPICKYCGHRIASYEYTKYGERHLFWGTPDVEIKEWHHQDPKYKGTAMNRTACFGQCKCVEPTPE